MENLKCKNRVVGFKQVKNALISKTAEAVYLAEDADSFIINPVKQLCTENSIECIIVSTKKELGKALVVDVPTAVAAILSE